MRYFQTEQFPRVLLPAYTNNTNNNNNDNDITSIALKSSEARAQKRNKTKSVIIFKSRGHTGIIISGAADYLRWKSNFEEISF